MASSNVQDSISIRNFTAASSMKASPGASSSMKASPGASSSNSSYWAESSVTAASPNAILKDQFRQNASFTENEQEFQQFSHQIRAPCSSWHETLNDQTWISSRNEIQNHYRLSAQSENRRSFDGVFEHSDGADLYTLLDEPTPVSNVFRPNSPLSSDHERTTKDLRLESVSQTEEKLGQHIEDCLQIPERYRYMTSEHPSALQPEFCSLVADNPKLALTIQELEANFQSGRDSPLFRLDEIERARLLDSWSEVLDSYTEDVWGPLLPVVKAAKSQVTDLRNSNSQFDNKAVARLKMILGHVVKDTSLEATTNYNLSRTYLDNMGRQSDRHLGSLQLPGISRQTHIQSSQGSMSIDQISHENATRTSKLGANMDNIQMANTTRFAGQQQKGMDPSQDDQNISLPEFHCPWVSCCEVSNYMMLLISYTHKL
jgi:hypothetical protein